MKPDTGFEMEEEPYDPRELFADVALLITEARTPDLSKKGRVEGPHCPPVQGSREHDCDRHKEQCRKASDILTQHKILLRNNIPMRIDVLLFPNCEHGLREETVVVGAMFSTVDAFILLERWDIQLINKRSSERHEGFVGGRSLLQAVRSYLHFSQLSSWLISTGGAISLRVVYRVYAPGETVGYTFERLPEVHNFPPADLGDAMMRASVTHIPRQNTMMSLFCRSPSPGVDQLGRVRKRLVEEKSGQKSPDLKVKNLRKSPDLKGAYEPMPSSSKCDDDYFGYSPPCASNKRHSKDHMEYGKPEKSGWGKSLQVADRPPSGKKPSDARYKRKEKEHKLIHDSDMYVVSSGMDDISSVLQESEACSRGHGHKREIDYCDYLATSRLPSNLETKASVIPPSSLPLKKPVSTDIKTLKLPGQLSPQKSHPYKKPSTLFCLSSQPTPFHITKRLPSPKVLMTASRKPEPSGYIKRCLDYDEEKSLLEADNDFSSFKQFEEISAADMQDLVKPLSPNQLDAYLSSLSHEPEKKMSLCKLDEIQMTKCRFFIGENEKSESDDVFESPDVEVKEDMIKADERVIRNQDQDLKLKHTAQSLSQKSPATGDNSSISSLSEESFKGGDNSDIKCLSSKSSYKETQEDLEQCLSEEPDFKEETINDAFINQELRSKLAEPDNNVQSIYTPEHRKTVNVSGRLLFHKSLSTSEVEDDLPSGKKSLKKVIHKLKTELKEPSLDYNEMFLSVFQDKQGKQGEERLENSVSGKYLSVSNEAKTDKVNTQTEIPIVSKQEGNQNYNNASLAKKKKPTRHNLDDISIPCTVGSGKTVIADLICDINDIDICADHSGSPSVNELSKTPLQNGSLVSSSVNRSVSPSNGSPSLSNGSLSPSNGSGSQSNGSPTPVFGSPNVDDEVKHHLKQSSQRGTSLNRGDNSNSPDIGLSLCKQLLQKGFKQCVENEFRSPGQREYKNLPSPDDIQRFQFNMARSASALFNSNTGLPTRSSPAPIKKKSSGSFDYDCTLTNVRAIKNAVSCSRLSLQFESKEETIEDPRIISTSAPASTNCLLGNFEESMLNGRIEPVGVVDGFTVEIGAGGTFCPKHVTLPVASYFFQLSDDNAPSPYLGHVNLEALGKRGYHIPRTGTVQVTLFNPNKTVVKMFVVMYDLSDMPASCQTFLRQRTMYMPVDKNSSEPSFLRYLIHLRFASTKSGKIYLHTDIRLIFARDKFEFDPRVANYELRSFTEGPQNPKFSPKR